MALISYYDTGFATVSNGSRDITGTGTQWLSSLRENDVFVGKDGRTARIGAVLSNTSLRLARNWPGDSQTSDVYEVRITPAPSEITASVRELLEKLRQGLWLTPNATGTLTERAAYDSARRGFIYMRTDVNPFLVYVKTTDATGAWSEGYAPQQGPSGPYTTIQIGTVTTVAPDQPAAINPVQVGDVVTLNFSIPRGPTGNIDGVTPFWVTRLGSDADAAAARAGLEVPSVEAVDDLVADAKKRENHTGKQDASTISNAYRTSSPFGLSGIRVIKGLEKDAHYGFNSAILDAGDGKLVIVYRKAANHAVTNGAQIRATDSYDGGETFVNDRLIFTDANCDTRNFVARVMAGGRLGIIACRRASGTLVYTSSVFIYSDDDGVTWSNTSVTSPGAGWGVNFHGSMIEHPTDPDGFIAYSYGHTGGHIDALVTTDNGMSWSWTTQVASRSGSVTALSEPAPVRVGAQNKWILLCRTSGQNNAVTFASSNPLSFSTQTDSGLYLAGNPPQALYDGATGLVWFIGYSRRGNRAIQAGSGLIENAMFVASADGDALFAASGSMASFGGWRVHCYLPDWASGYIHPFEIGGKWWGTFVCGEAYPSHAFSRLCLIGDFAPSGADRASLAGMFATSKSNEVTEGTWTPTLTNVVNVASSGALECHYQRVGNFVTCWGAYTAAATAAGSTQTIRMSIPIPSTFTTSLQGRGLTATTSAERGGTCNSDVATNTMALSSTPESTANRTWTFYFSYIVQ